VAKARHVLFHKPYGVLTQFTSEGERPTLKRFGLPAGVYPAGRLDHDSEGLLFLTDDGGLVRRLLDPRRGHPRTYWAQVERVPTDEALLQLARGVTLADGKTLPCKVRRLESEPDLPPRDPPIRERRSVPTAWLELTLMEGRNRQVRRMTAAVGHPTLRLVRVAIGALRIEGLAQGAWRWVDASELKPR
jgi:23S rRNA pseudouridine2457 synthase